MMTMHSAKGLEFPVVFVVGAEEGVFPGSRVIGEPEEMEEERRLCYVAMTRAKEKLYLTCANQRMLFGRTSSNSPSRFTGEIPAKHLERTGRTSAFDFGDSDWGGMPSRTSGYGGYGGTSYAHHGAERAAYGEQRRSQSRTSYGGFERAMSGGSSYGGSAYGARAARPAAPAGGIKSAAAGTPAPTFQKGDMVKHKAFGSGMVLSVQKMGGDALLEIAFDNVGTKRLMQKSAAAHMEKQ